MNQTLPMPNDKQHGATVIASCDQENGQYEVLALTTTPDEFYQVWVMDASTLEILHVKAFANIVPASRAYGDAIGY